VRALTGAISHVRPHQGHWGVKQTMKHSARKCYSTIWPLHKVKRANHLVVSASSREAARTIRSQPIFRGDGKQINASDQVTLQRWKYRLQIWASNAGPTQVIDHLGLYLAKSGSQFLGI